jgi:hypothetical protein
MANKGDTMKLTQSILSATEWRQCSSRQLRRNDKQTLRCFILLLVRTPGMDALAGQPEGCTY